MKFVTKMDTLVYVHHHGMYWLPDTTTKVAMDTKQMNFIELFYDLTYTLPLDSHEEDHQKCEEYKINSFDYCINEVSSNILQII